MSAPLPSPENATSNQAREALRAAMVRLAQGDSAALEEIYSATRVKLFGICYRILGDRKEAEDALQDVYVNLWQRADRYDPQRASPISWLATFARNRAIDRLRTGKVRSGAVPVEEAAPLPDETPLADALLVDAERDAQIHKCLTGLDENAQIYIRAAFFEFFSQVSHMSVNKIKIIHHINIISPKVLSNCFFCQNTVFVCDKIQ